MKRLPLFAAVLLCAPLAAQEPADPPTPASVAAAAEPDEWRAIDPADLLVMTLAPDAKGEPREVVIQLMPPPFSQPWVENIRALARAHWWDGTSVYRAVDNWVTQWGDVDEAKPLPEGLSDTDDLPYTSTAKADLSQGTMEPEVVPLPAPDPYTGLPSSDRRISWSGGVSGFSRGWPVAVLPERPPPNLDDIDASATGEIAALVWPIHCYAHVGVARDLESTGTGSELYAVIGHAPRQLDRNIAVVGRVIEGIEHLSTLPRGTGEAGVYETEAERTPIVSVRLGDELPEAKRPRFEYLGSDSESFAEYVDVRANRNDAFYTVPAGGVDVCNVQVPIRRMED